jgi:CheY-like chemotaxis protein/HPt (histidine-containing phosphotransfer) domain-containing protein
MILSRSIVLVEDSDSDRLLFSKYLKQMGYDCISLDCADKLIARIDEFEPSIILMDIEMPGITGIEAVAILRKRQETNGDRHIIIALTAHNDENIMSILSAAGFDDYLQKPVTKHELKARLSHYLKNESEIGLSVPAMNSNNGNNHKDKLYSLDMFEADDPEFVRSIVEMFVANTPGSIAMIKKAFDLGEMETVRQQAHKLKPHFTFFGASGVQQMFQMIEDIAKGNEDKEKLPELIDCAEKTSVLMIAQMKEDLLS